MRIRIAIWLGEIILGCLAGYAMYLGLKEVALAAAVGIVALLPKLVEAERDVS